MKRRRLKYLVAAGIVIAALAGLVYSGVKESMVYFYTPSELMQKRESVQGKALRVGGMVVDGSVQWDPQTLLLTFQLTDGEATVSVRHKGTAPDLFKEDAGAVVEGAGYPRGFSGRATSWPSTPRSTSPPRGRRR